MLKPGHPEAIKKGCTCPSEPNQDGHGAYRTTPESPSETQFLIVMSCPIHGESSWKD